MTCNESDDTESIYYEIQKLKQKLKNIDDELYLLNSKRRLIYHRLADLQYELGNKDMNELETNN